MRLDMIAFWISALSQKSSFLTFEPSFPICEMEIVMIVTETSSYVNANKDYWMYLRYLDHYLEPNKCSVN